MLIKETLLGPIARLMRLIGDDEGIKAVELGLTLFLVAFFVALAGPALSSLFYTFEEAAAAIEVRSAAVASEVITAQGGDLDAIQETLEDTAVTSGGATQVAGVALEHSGDGAVCLWREAANGTVFAVWQLEGRTLYATFGARPDRCPTAQTAEAVGFGPRF